MEIRKAAAEDFDIVFDFIEKLWTYNTYDREEIRKVYMDVIDDERSFAFLFGMKAFAEVCAMETISIHSGCRGSHAMCQVS